MNEFEKVKSKSQNEKIGWNFVELWREKPSSFTFKPENFLVLSFYWVYVVFLISL